MRIGFVSTWFERGAAYVTSQFESTLASRHTTFVYARAGETYAKGNPIWDRPNVTWGLRLDGTAISWSHFRKWVDANDIELVFFNEQADLEPVLMLRKERPDVKIGSYVDYYREDSVNDFRFYDFLICNTQRHYSVFRWHPQCYYIPWGTDTKLFSCKRESTDGRIRFFHSVGMSARKGTDILISAFVKSGLYRDSKLILHTQVDIGKLLGIDVSRFSDHNIELVHATIPAPGLYHKGDVYVYPTKLEGIGLTIFEALSCGMPVITTDNAPMNEVVNDDVGRLISVERFVSRADGYYWPLSICNVDSLVEGMRYYVDNNSSIGAFSKRARDYAVDKLDWAERTSQVLIAFENSRLIEHDREDFIRQLKRIRRAKRVALGRAFIDLLPASIQHWYYSNREKAGR